MAPTPHIGLQAVILCGPGTSLHPFTSAIDLPKALLPIANKPMLHYPLEWCEKAGFDSVLILTLAEHHGSIQSFIRSRSSPIDIQIEAPSSLDENIGTADVLRLAYKAGWVKGDFVVLPCDLVTDLDPHEALKIWMVDQAGFDPDIGRRGRKDVATREDTSGRRGGLGVWYETKGVEGAARGQETDFLAVAPKASTVSDFPTQLSGSLNTLLFNLSAEAVKSDGVPIRQSLFKKYPNFQLLSTRRDSGIYFFPFWVLKFIDRNPKINSIREDLLPWWSKCCWQNKRLAKKLGLDSILAGDESNIAEKRYDVGDMSTTRKRDVKKWTIENDYEDPPGYSAERLEQIAKAKRGIVVFPIMPQLKSETSSVIFVPEEVMVPSITAYLPTPSTAFIRRVDTIQLYLVTSLYLASPSVSSSYKIHASASIDPKASVCRVDCLIAAKVTIAEKADIRRCVLGYGVTIAKGSRLLGCVLMDGASVGEGVKLEGCVVGRHAVIGVGAKLQDCQVADGFFVEEGTQVKGECFVAFAGLDTGPDSGFGLDGTYDMEDAESDNDLKDTTGLDSRLGLDGTYEVEDTKSENDQKDTGDLKQRYRSITIRMLLDEHKDANEKRKLQKVCTFPGVEEVTSPEISATEADFELSEHEEVTTTRETAALSAIEIKHKTQEVYIFPGVEEASPTGLSATEVDSMLSGYEGVIISKETTAPSAIEREIKRQKVSPIEISTTEVDSELIGYEGAITSKLATVTSATGLENTDVPGCIPVAPPGMVRWWLSGVFLVWLAPVLVLGIWYGVVRKCVSVPL